MSEGTRREGKRKDGGYKVRRCSGYIGKEG